MRGVSKRYPPREQGLPAQELLRGVDLIVERGEFVAVEGQSGSGKSTLLHLLGGLDREFDGEAHVLGCDLRAVSDAELSALRHTQIGFVFQSFNLLPALSALENVLLPDFFGDGVPDAERRAREALDRVGLLDKARARPAALSGGERQRVAIARALLPRPPLLLADEPTGNLDARTGEGVIALFRKLHAEGMTLLIVTHEARVSHAASRVLVLREGMLQTDGAAAMETE
ncbi:MAG TPA: ABC transporter ATP-binding protein [Myxococcales bacterium]|nr:ABC transporter ATP-binding protein [Myxococcales bacterium]